jgi:hypothetical protein
MDGLVIQIQFLEDFGDLFHAIFGLHNETLHLNLLRSLD